MRAAEKAALKSKAEEERLHRDTAMAAHKGEAPTWGYDELDAFITAPARYVPGTKMSFAGLRDEETRVNLIAYLQGTN